MLLRDESEDGNRGAGRYSLGDVTLDSGALVGTL